MLQPKTATALGGGVDLCIFFAVLQGLVAVVGVSHLEALLFVRAIKKPVTSKFTEYK